MKPLIKATLFTSIKVRGRLFWRLENYIEVQLSHILSVESNRKIIRSHRATVAVAIFRGKRIAKGPRGRIFEGSL